METKQTAVEWFAEQCADLFSQYMDNFIKKVVEPIIIVLLIGFVIVMGAIYVAITRNIEGKQVNKVIEQKSTY